MDQLFNINHDQVYRRSKHLLAQNPYLQAYGIADFPGFAFNGYYWTLINNVVVVYRISQSEEKVFIDACYYANTEQSAEIFWDIDPNDESA